MMKPSNTKTWIASAVLAGVACASVPTQSANAGILLFTATTITGVAEGWNDSPITENWIGMVVGTLGFATVAVGMATGNVPLLLLGADGSLPQDQIAQTLAQRYTFIQDREVLSDLASLIKTKAEAQKPVDGKILVSISREEIEDVLKATDLMETHPAEVTRMVNELK